MTTEPDQVHLMGTSLLRFGALMTACDLGKTLLATLANLPYSYANFRYGLASVQLNHY